MNILGFPCGSAGKESSCNTRRPGFDPWVGKIPWRRERLPSPIFWPREFHEWYRDRKESDTTEQLSLHFSWIYYYIFSFFQLRNKSIAILNIFPEVTSPLVSKTLFHEDVGKRIRILWGIQKKIVDLVLFLEKGTRDQHTRII